MDVKEIIKDLSPLDLHNLLHITVEKLNTYPYVYDSKYKETYYDYFASNVTACYDAREELTK